MGLHDPRLAWTLVLRPRVPWAEELPEWPEVVTQHFADVDLGRSDPIDSVLRGPFPLRVLGRSGSLVLSGLGDAVAITSVAQRPGELERDSPAAELREEAVDAMLGEGTGVAGIRAQLADVSGWEVAGLIEVEAVLSEGLSEDLPDVPGWKELGNLRIQRATGVGEGHAAWHVEGWFSRKSEKMVMDQRLNVLCAGHRARTAPLVDFGHSAVQWGTAAATAGHRSRAVEAVIADVRMATAEAIGGGSADALPALTARLERARTSLAEVILALRARRPELLRAADRVLGEGGPASADGPLVEAAGRAEQMVQRLGDLEAVAARWADALAAAQRLHA